jgi:hypothetical protein
VPDEFFVLRTPITVPAGASLVTVKLSMVIVIILSILAKNDRPLGGHYCLYLRYSDKSLVIRALTVASS